MILWPPRAARHRIEAMDRSNPTPYADLSPDRVLDVIEALGLAPDGHMLALNSYENRVYQIGLEDAEPVVAKFYRPERWSDAAILEEHALVAALAEREIPAVAPLVIRGHSLHHVEGHRIALYPRRGGRAPELEDPEVLAWIGRYLGRIHALGAVSDFSARPALDIDTFGVASRDWLLASDWLPPELRDDYARASAEVIEAARAAYARAGEPSHIRLHGDCHRGNILWTDAGPHFVDFDDARMGPAVQDLWMLLAGSREEMCAQLIEVLAGYEDFHDFDHRELHLIEALRALRLLHHAVWLARRWSDPAFPPAFPWFGTPHYWQGHISELRGQCLAMEAGPLWSA